MPRHGASARYDLVTPAGETTTERHDDVTAPLPAPGDRRRTLLAFAPYVVVSMLHVAVLVAGLDDAARRRSSSSCRRSCSPCC